MPCPSLHHRPLPLELIRTLPDTLNGFNRAKSNFCHLEAENDLEAIMCWLTEFKDSPGTYRSYRKEAERLLVWSLKQRNKALSHLTREDLMEYQKFIANPHPVEYWCGQRQPRHSDHWKPFQGPLSASSQRQAMTIINGLFSYLVNAGYLLGNPLSLMRQRKIMLNPDIKNPLQQERFLDQKTWRYLKKYIYAMPRDTKRQIAQYERILFLFHILYLLAPRVSEVSNHCMNSFRNYRGKWWWFITGKGNKHAKIPINDAMLEALVRYRRSLGLSDYPAEHDSSPLLRGLGGVRNISANMIYRIVKSVVQGAAESIREIAPHKAAVLQNASTHWFRHTSITHQDDVG
ncbi:MAG: site-specific integrase, partial [Pseudomonadales bacterium]